MVTRPNILEVPAPETEKTIEQVDAAMHERFRFVQMTLGQRDELGEGIDSMLSEHWKRVNPDKQEISYVDYESVMRGVAPEITMAELVTVLGPIGAENMKKDHCIGEDRRVEAFKGHGKSVVYSLNNLPGVSLEVRYNHLGVEKEADAPVTSFSVIKTKPSNNW